MKRQSGRGGSGFTLIELMIVLVIIAIIAAIAIPNLIAARLNADETSAVSTLRTVSSAQSQFQVGGKCDVDGDGTGEYGMFRELSGASAIRTASDGTNVGGKILNPPSLSGVFRTLNAVGCASHSGYLFAMLLPMANGDAVTETPGNGAFSNLVGADVAETSWAAYAWPASYQTSGIRTFFVNQAGDITSADSSSYSGAGRPNPVAAFRTGAAPNGMTGRVAVGTKGVDGNMWKQVN
jgi:prepilin-type N-terminal cleavage/methylation domain-containing protein